MRNVSAPSDITRGRWPRGSAGREFAANGTVLMARVRSPR